ncbi:hypothetical protein O3M35_002087 [Rhynocoris fuscipes]|uniref:dolichyl-P-Man:Man5GlcNAc2-PP-dolichol alpha-1,3-mannosyltransferase n=1 Tax=Rhynocoris fuscipes TaxID=488301 RepID=A0AAW1CXW1_9HEMI
MAKSGEIDWLAYMQEVEGFLNGTYNYSLLKGDTGPLVYPAGFVYIYSLLYYVTDKGTDIRIAQYIFLGLYIISLYLIFRIYILTKKVPAYMLIFMCCTSYRVHSLYMLRLFNDPFAMALLYLSLNLFLNNKWTFGSIIYSLAVSVKMNILLFSPALFIAYLSVLGTKDTIIQITICAIVQLLLGSPFLLTDPVAYIKGSFDIGRVFLHKWTVNWRFLPEILFINTKFHILLLSLHLILLLIFAKIAITYLQSYAKLKFVENDVVKQIKKHSTPDINMSTVSQLFIFPMFLANFIGITCSRSLHYQFYIWYYHTLPYLLWCTDLSVTFRLLLLGFIELSWNTYPSTNISSAILHVCHIVLMYHLYKTNNARLKSKENAK